MVFADQSSCGVCRVSRYADTVCCYQQSCPNRNGMRQSKLRARRPDVLDCEGGGATGYFGICGVSAILFLTNSWVKQDINGVKDSYHKKFQLGFAVLCKVGLLALIMWLSSSFIAQPWALNPHFVIDDLMAR